MRSASFPELKGLYVLLVGCAMACGGKPKGTSSATAPPDAALNDAGSCSPLSVGLCYGDYVLASAASAAQAQNCRVQLTFPVRIQDTGVNSSVLWISTECVTHGFDWTDAGVPWNVIGVDAGSENVTVDLALSGEACDLVSANSDASIYLLFLSAACTHGPV